MSTPENLLFTQDHEWVEFSHDRRSVKMGITDFAQKALGDIVFVQPPSVGADAQLGMTFGEVESSKSVSDLYAPINGVVVSINEDLTESPQRLNDDPYGRGWICTIELTDEVETSHLLDHAGYESLIKG